MVGVKLYLFKVSVKLYLFKVSVKLYLFKVSKLEILVLLGVIFLH